MSAAPEVRCTACNQVLRVEDVGDHLTMHNARDAEGALDRLPPYSRMRVLARYCTECGFKDGHHDACPDRALRVMP